MDQPLNINTRLEERFEEEMLLLEQNDPRCTGVDITQDDRLPYHKVDWAKRGGAIANNTHLESLYVELYDCDDKPVWKDANSFYRALSLNRSITELYINFYMRDVESIFKEMIIPFFHDNDTICKFVFNGDINSMSSQWLISALASNNKKSLRQITLGSIGSMHMAKVIDEIATYENIKVLSLNYLFNEDDDMIYNEEVCIAVGNLLINPLSKLEELTLDDGDGSIIGDEGLTIIGRAIPHNTTLKRINGLDDATITSLGWETFFGFLANSCLEELLLSHQNISDEALAELGTSLATMNTLKVLSLTYNELITQQGWLHFFDQLHDMPGLTLESLDLSENVFGEEGNALIVNGLTNVQSLKSIDVSCRDPNSTLFSHDPLIPDPRRALITTAFANLLQTHASNLEYLCVSIVDMNDEVVIQFAASLVGNTSLKSVSIENNNIWWKLETVSSNGWDALANVLCNTSSIESIYNSNHTLQKISFTDDGLVYHVIDSEEK